MTPLELELLGAAREGDENAFRRLVEPRHAELHAHCYRMLGSVHDAEDALQDALLRAWRGMGRFEGRSSLRSWLYKIATNTCLDAISRRPKRVLPIDYGPTAEPHTGPGAPLAEGVWLEPYADQLVEDGYASPEARYEQRESVELAFVAALQHLPANQRAALILREVLGFSAKEVAGALETSVQSVNSALQRARETVDDRLPEQSQQATLRALGDDQLAGIVENYMTAIESGDVERVVSLLAEDATWSMPPVPELVPRSRGRRRLPGRVPPQGALAARPHARQRATGGRLLHLVRRDAELPRGRARRHHSGGHEGPRRHGLPRAVAVRPLRRRRRRDDARRLRALRARERDPGIARAAAR
jgi:RNA polymerase sigma-70 factor (ECF subfamily)